MPEILKLTQMNNATEMMIVIMKLVDFHKKKATKTEGESALKALHHSVNELLLHVRLNNHQLLRVNPLFAFSAKGLCTMQTIEKENTLKVLTKLSEQCDKDRQVAYETYPNNKELVNQLLADLENAFPKETLNKCKKKKK